MAKIDKNLLESPFGELPGDPHDLKPGSGEWDGVKGLPERTKSPNAVPEKFIDGSFGPKGKE